MRRLIVSATAAFAVVALAPASALAHNHHHARHHRRVHHLRLGDVTPAPTTPATAIGTIESNTNGTLVIKLNDGTTLSGAVTADTRVECMSPAIPMTLPGSSGTDLGSTRSDWFGPSGSGDDDNGQGDDNQECASTGLTPGTSVTGAELRISSVGSVWEKLELGM
jgi:hypothetical protein